MIGSPTLTVKRFSIITKNTTISTTTSTTSKKRRDFLDLVSFLLLLLFGHGTIHSTMKMMMMTLSTYSRRVVAFSVHQQNHHHHHHSVGLRSTTTAFRSSSSSLSYTSLSSSNNNNSESLSSQSTTVPETSTPRVNNYVGNTKFTIPRRSSSSTTANPKSKFFPKKINTSSGTGSSSRSYSTNGGRSTNHNGYIPSRSFSTTSSFEDDDLDAALDNVLSSSPSSSTMTRNTPDVKYNPVRALSII
jgi:hypothetical protein